MLGSTWKAVFAHIIECRKPLLGGGFGQSLGMLENILVIFVHCDALAGTHTALGNLPQALDAYSMTNRMFEVLHESYPQNVSFKDGLAISYSQLGRFYRDKMNDRPKAQPYFHKCYDIWQELSEQFPAYQEFRNNYEWAKRQLGK